VVGAFGQDVYAVMSARGYARTHRPQGIDDPDRVCFGRQMLYVCLGSPTEACYLLIGGQMSASDLASKHQRDDPLG
jgi:hypothetical protein